MVNCRHWGSAGIVEFFVGRGRWRSKGLSGQVLQSEDLIGDKVELWAQVYGE